MPIIGYRFTQPLSNCYNLTQLAGEVYTYTFHQQVLKTTKLCCFNQYNSNLFYFD